MTSIVKAFALQVIVILCIHHVDTNFRINIFRGKQDVFSNPRCLSHQRATCSDCDGFNAECVEKDCTNCRCFENRTFVSTRGRYGECVENQVFIYAISYNSSFLVQRKDKNKCLGYYKRPKYNTYAVVKQCKDDDLSQRWIWNRIHQLVNMDTLKCLSAERNPSRTNNKHHYLILEKCNSIDENQLWRCAGHDSSLFRQRISPSYMYYGYYFSYVTSYQKETHQIRWQRLGSNQPICSESEGCNGYADGSAMLILDELACSTLSADCAGQKEISMRERWDECSILGQQTQYLNQDSWNSISLKDDIFHISQNRGKVFLQWDLDKASEQWSGLIVKLQLDCRKQKNGEQFNETHCILVKFIGNFSESPCDSETCFNGGRCQRSGNSFVCFCVDGYWGKRCENENLCNSNPCQNRGKCTTVGNSFQCMCPSGYDGETCERKSEAYNSSFLVQERGKNKCLGYLKIPNNPFALVEQCNNDDLSQRWMWNHYDQLVNMDTLKCLLAQGSSAPGNHNHRYVKLEKCNSTDENQLWTCAGHDSSLIRQWISPSYLYYGYDYSYVTSYQNETDQIRWHRFGSNRSICSEFEENPCNSNPCQNRGNCTTIGNSFQCMCPSGYNGKTCERKVKESPTKSGEEISGDSGSSKTVIIIVCVILALIIISAATGLMIYLRRKRSSKNEQPRITQPSQQKSSSTVQEAAETENPLYETNSPSDSGNVLYEPTPDHAYQNIDTTHTIAPQELQNYTYDYAVNDGPRKLANHPPNYDHQGYNEVSTNEPDLDPAGNYENITTETSPKYYVLEKE